MYIERFLSGRLTRLARHAPVVVVSGARQVGKSTLCRHVFNRAEYVLFESEKEASQAKNDPELFLKSRSTPIILDEIQYAPELVSAIKRHADLHRKKGQFILTGSQQWSVIKNMAESLAGRALFLDLEGFSLAELGRSTARKPWLARWLDNPAHFARQKAKLRLKLKRSVFDQVWRGWMPEAQFMPRDLISNFYTSYQRTYTERDIRMLAKLDDLQLFGRFVRLLGALTSQEINHSELGRELGLHPATTKHWLSLLTACFQWHEVPAYHGNAIKRLSGRTKGYFADTGYACYAQSISSPEALSGHPLWGAMFETAVMGEIRKQLSTMPTRPNIYHWRTHAGAEVDALLEYNGKYYPIEVKGKSRPDRHDASGIKAFRETYPNLKIEKGLIIAPTESFYAVTENDYAAPWDLA
jgi:uncharacterized protein